MQIALYVAAALVVVLAALYALNRFVWFYRDPARTPEATGRVLVSPADGQIVYIKRFEDGAVSSEKLGRSIRLDEIAELPQTAGRSGWIVGIYMSPFDVHFNYAPVAGRVTAQRYRKADANLPMVDLSEYIRIAFLRRPFDNFAAAFHLENERNTVVIQPGPGSEAGQPDVAVVEIADKYVNKIDILAGEGDELRVGGKLGFIKRGSQVDLIVFADDVEWTAVFGQQVYGGKTVLGRF
ncbi:MAG TPA: phosphatidylserine decarboxylase [Coriobacteriia bacterium]